MVTNINNFSITTADCCYVVYVNVMLLHLDRHSRDVPPYNKSVCQSDNRALMPK